MCSKSFFPRIPWGTFPTIAFNQISIRPCQSPVLSTQHEASVLGGDYGQAVQEAQGQCHAHFTTEAATCPLVTGVLPVSWLPHFIWLWETGWCKSSARDDAATLRCPSHERMREWDCVSVTPHHPLRSQVMMKGTLGPGPGVPSKVIVKRNLAVKFYFACVNKQKPHNSEQM